MDESNSKPEAGADPVIREETAFTVVGIGGRFISIMSPDANNFEKVPGFWHAFINRADELSNRVDETTWGVCSPVDPSDKEHDAEFHYVAGAPVDGDTIVPEGMEAVSIPARTYAIFTHRGPITSLAETYDRIHGQWFPTSGYRHAGGSELERYDGRFDGGATSEMEIWVPIR